MKTTYLCRTIPAVLCTVALFTVVGLAQETAKLAGLKSTVTVKRDSRGIPYIQATNEHDLYAAQGFVTARDRLWQMEMLRRVANGETAEIFGPAALDRDKRWRRFGFSKISEESYKRLAPDTRAALDSYSVGVNAYIRSLSDNQLPTEFKILRFKPREWTPADSLIVGKILADGLSSSWFLDLRRLNFSDLPRAKQERLFPVRGWNDVLLIGKDNPVSATQTVGDLVSLPRISEPEIALAERIREESLALTGFYAEGLAASNNWVVSGKKTKDGKPILANDPHLEATAPPIWYMVHLAAPGMRVAGVTLPGAAGVVLGHNQHVAWGATNVGPDVQDLYLETFDDADPTKYKVPGGGWAQAEITKEKIAVRKNPLDPASIEYEEIDVVRTINGVITVEEGKKKYALKWTALDRTNDELSAFHALNRVKNWAEFKKALSSYGGPMQNFVYADVKGNIGWYSAGRVPIRRKGNGELPYDGSTKDGDWMGYIPFSELPYLYNPPSGMIVTANQRTVGESFRYQQLVRSYASPHRAHRIYELLKDRNDLTVEDMMTIQHDTRNELLKRLAKVVANSPGISSDTRGLFTVWDGNMNPDSKAALLASEMLFAIRQKTLEHVVGADKARAYQFGNESSLWEWLLDTRPKDWLAPEFTDYSQLFRYAENTARQNLTKRFGADEKKWVWGNNNPMKFFHPLTAAPLIGAQFEAPSLPRIGSGLSPNVGVSVSMRLVATPGNWDLTRQVIPLGQSGNPADPLWRDQQQLWYTGTSPLFVFSEQAVNRMQGSTLTLSP